MRAVSFRRTEQGIAARRIVAAKLQLEKLQVPEKLEKPQNVVASSSIIILKKKKGYQPSFHSVAARLCVFFGYSMAEIRSTKRDDDIVFARQAICYWTRRLTGQSLTQIGRLVGGRDHTTILHAIEAYPKKRAAVSRTLPALSNRVVRVK